MTEPKPTTPMSLSQSAFAQIISLIRPIGPIRPFPLGSYFLCYLVLFGAVWCSLVLKLFFVFLIDRGVSSMLFAPESIDYQRLLYRHLSGCPEIDWVDVPANFFDLPAGAMLSDNPAMSYKGHL